MQEPGTPFAASSTEGAAQRQQETLEGPRSSTERLGKLRGWSGRLGEQFTSVLDTLSKGELLQQARHQKLHERPQRSTLSSASPIFCTCRSSCHATYALHVRYAITVEGHLGWWVAGLLPHQYSHLSGCTLQLASRRCGMFCLQNSRSKSHFWLIFWCFLRDLRAHPYC